MAAPQAFFRLDLQDRIDKYRDKSVLRSQPAQLSLDAWSQSYDLMDGLEVSGPDPASLGFILGLGVHCCTVCCC